MRRKNRHCPQPWTLYATVLDPYYAIMTQQNTFELNKSIWKQSDFQEMGWHDASIYGISIEKKAGQQLPDLQFDIDYIFKWVNPGPSEHSFSFWVAPCTLVFHEIFALQIDIDSGLLIFDSLEIDDIELIRTETDKKGETQYFWEIGLHIGAIYFQSKGFTQIVKKQPVHTIQQGLSIDQRGTVNFSITPYS
jgi:hypothetical protein